MRLGRDSGERPELRSTASGPLLSTSQVEYCGRPNLCLGGLRWIDRIGKKKCFVEPSYGRMEREVDWPSVVTHSRGETTVWRATRLLLGRETGKLPPRAERGWGGVVVVWGAGNHFTHPRDDGRRYLLID